MAALVATQWHLWLNLSQISEKDRVFLLDAPISPSGLFGNAEDKVVDRFQEAKKQTAAFQLFFPRRSQSGADRQNSLWAPLIKKAGPGLRTIIFNKKASAKRSWGYQPRTSEGRPLWGRAAHTSVYGACLSSEPSGDRSVSPATLGASGQSNLQQVSLSASAPNHSGPERFATSKKCLKLLDWPSSSKHTRGQSRETVPLEHFLAVWKLLPNVSRWVLRTVERGYKIQFGSRPPLFNRVFPTLVAPEQALVMEKEVDILLRKEAIEVVPPRDRESGFCSRYFIIPKKVGGLRPNLYLRLLNHSVMRLKFKMLTIKQDVSQIRCEDCFFYDISERRLFPCIHSSSTPEVAKVCFRGQSIPMSGFSVRPSTLTPHFHKVCGCCSGSPATPCHPHTELHRWLVDSSSIRAVSSSTSRCHSLSHERLGVKAKRKEKCTSSSTEDDLSGCCVGFNHDAGTSVSCSNRVDPCDSQKSERRPVTHCEAFSEAVGSDGSYVQRGLLHMIPLKWWLRTTGFSRRATYFAWLRLRTNAYMP